MKTPGQICRDAFGKRYDELNHDQEQHKDTRAREESWEAAAEAVCAPLMQDALELLTLCEELSELTEWLARRFEWGVGYGGVKARTKSTLEAARIAIENRRKAT
jgi:hypothetical protein